MRSFRTALRLALPIASALALAMPAHADVKDGVDAWQAGDFAKAVAEWRPLALAGDADAQFNLGQAYKLGRGVPVDLTQAESWYRRAAKQGHLQAEDNLGLVIFTAGRQKEAMPYIIRSAERGEPRAQYVLGTALFNGDLIAKDWPRSYALTKRASDAGLTVASARLVQLDQLVPLDQRQRGLAMLPQMEKDETRARLAAVSAGAPEPDAAPAPTIRTASLPASEPGASYAPPPLIEPQPSAAKPAKARDAATAASEATADAVAATAAAKPGTSYAAPPLAGPLPATPAAAPAPKRIRVEPAATPDAAPKPAPVRAATAGPWRAQLGAFAVDGNAKKLWATLARKYPAVAAQTPAYVKAGSVTRLHATGFATRADAQGFCATLQKSGQACLVVDK